MDPRSLKPTKQERILVEKLAGIGLPQTDIALLIRDGINFKTLTKHFEFELKRGKAKANEKIATKLFEMAMEGNTAAAIFWTKSQMKWSERHEVAHMGADGPPIKHQTESKIDYANMTDDELATVVEILTKSEERARTSQKPANNSRSNKSQVIH